jgi:hypothetical protein
VLPVVLDQFQLQEPQQQQQQQQVVAESAIEALAGLVRSEAGRQLLLCADPACLQRVLLQLLQLMATAGSSSWYKEAAGGSDVSGDDEDEAQPKNLPIYCSKAAWLYSVVAVLLGVPPPEVNGPEVVSVPLQLRQLYSALGPHAGQLLDWGMQLTQRYLDIIWDEDNNDVHWMLWWHGSMALLALTRALQAAGAAAAGCLQELLPRAASMLEVAQQLDYEEPYVMACEWCEALAWLWRTAEQLQLPCSTADIAGASSEQQSLAQVAAGAAALLIPHIEVNLDDWEERETRTAAMLAVGVLASSAVGRHGLAATSGSWEEVVDALWMDMSEPGNADEEGRSATHLRGYPASNILLATARAAAAGEEPPFLQHLLHGLKDLQDDPDTAEGQDDVVDDVHAHYRWMICQCCSIAASCNWAVSNGTTEAAACATAAATACRRG